jgi:hypothetical protein
MLARLQRRGPVALAKGSRTNRADRPLVIPAGGLLFRDRSYPSALLAATASRCAATIFC